MAGLCWLKEEKGKQSWVEGQELPTVMSTFGCVVANIQHEVLKQQWITSDKFGGLNLHSFSIWDVDRDDSGSDIL